MIKLSKTHKPKLLCDHAETWTQKLLDHHFRNEKIPSSIATKYKEAEIKKALKEETKDKCAYCESKLSHAQYGDVEHIKPKTKFIELTFEWENLTFACTICNTNKSDYYCDQYPILNPYTHNPEDHLDAIGGWICGFDHSPAGQKTDIKLKLNRSDLVLRRNERIGKLMPLVHKCESETDSIKKTILLEQLNLEALSDKEYSFIVLKMLQQRGLFISTHE